MRRVTERPSDPFETEAARIDRLSPREREVSVLVAKGLTNPQIAARLFISATTVRHHLTAIFRKLRIANRFELIVLCFRHELVVAPTDSTSSDDTQGGRHE